MLRWDQIRASVTRRKVQSLPSALNEEIALDLELSHALDADVLTRLTMDGIHAAKFHHDNRMSALRIYASPKEVRIVLPPIGRGLMRLESFIALHQKKRGRLPAELAAYLVETIARVSGDLAAGDKDGNGAHGYLSKRAVLLKRSGKIVILGSGSDLVTALMVPPPADEIERYRWAAPEAARGEARDALGDVYSLAVLYYELLAGHPYRMGVSALEMSLATLEGLEPEIPGRLPDPRGSLLTLLERALASDRAERFESPSLFADEIRNELEANGLKTARFSDLAQAIEEVVPADFMETPAALLGGDAQAPESPQHAAPPLPPIRISSAPPVAPSFSTPVPSGPPPIPRPPTLVPRAVSPTKTSTLPPVQSGAALPARMPSLPPMASVPAQPARAAVEPPRPAVPVPQARPRTSPPIAPSMPSAPADRFAPSAVNAPMTSGPSPRAAPDPNAWVLGDVDPLPRGASPEVGSGPDRMYGGAQDVRRESPPSPPPPPSRRAPDPNAWVLGDVDPEPALRPPNPLPVQRITGAPASPPVQRGRPPSGPGRHAPPQGGDVPQAPMVTITGVPAGQPKPSPSDDDLPPSSRPSQPRFKSGTKLRVRPVEERVRGANPENVRIIPGLGNGNKE